MIFAKNLKTQALSISPGSERVFLTCQVEVCKGNSLSVAPGTPWPGLDSQMVWPPSPPGPPGEGGGGGTYASRECNHFFDCACGGIFLVFWVFWSPKTIKMELEARPRSNFLHRGGKCVFERPYMDLAWFSVSGALAERLISWKKHVLPQRCRKVHPKAIFYRILMGNWDPMNRSKRTVAVLGSIFFITFWPLRVKRYQEPLRRVTFNPKTIKNRPQSTNILWKGVSI